MSAAEAGLGVDVVVQRGSFELTAAFTVAPGGTLAVLGANAAGKSTLLHSIAGLVAIERGRIECDGVILDDGAATFRLPETRPVGYVFQATRLFPHLSALDNVAFGLRSRGMAKIAARDRACAELESLGLEGYADLRPDALSGGQAQRIALARTLVTEPRVALLDEPFTAIDAAARPEVRSKIMGRLAELGAITLLVTHDAEEAASVTDHSIELVDGQIVRASAPHPPR